jgi:hypothetical protein
MRFKGIYVRSGLAGHIDLVGDGLEVNLQYFKCLLLVPNTPKGRLIRRRLTLPPVLYLMQAIKNLTCSAGSMGAILLFLPLAIC